MARWTFLLLWFRLFSIVFSEYKDSESLCASQQTCRSCVQTPRCVWCSTKLSDANTNAVIRCVTRKQYLKEGDRWCPHIDVVDDANSMKVIENRTLSSKKGTNPVQVQPQKISLKLRRGEEYRVTVKYSQADDYPVDLYYLMDLSFSMMEHRNRLSELGFKLAEAMRKLTSNFRLGFGSFVDKVVMPMTNVQPEKLKQPCAALNKVCAPSYGYQHQMSLNEDIALFKTRVKQAPISANVDTPEGGFDAMMQAIVCTKEIGWRQNARRLIVFSTDAVSHLAGDGRLAGILEPNDCLCHLDEKGFYSYSLLQDYPSIAQINNMARENNMNIIFAIVKGAEEAYQQLSGSISGSSIGTLDDDSKNIVTLISGEYEKLVQSVTMLDNATKMVDVKYFSRCLENNGELKERRECGGLRVGNVVEFEVALKALDCPEDPDEWRQTIEIKPGGIKESLTIDLSIVCDCSCDRPGQSGNEPNSKYCNGHSDLVCGVCSCQDGFYGKQCECKGNDFGARNEIDMAECKPNNETNEICNGRGVCKCGMCDCDKRSNPQEIFYGKYCECNNFSCKRSDGLICGGRGKCECGTCNCFPGWGGETCDCKETNSTCIQSNSEHGDICNGRGDCVCGSCHCHEKDNVRYSGQYCEECTTCPGQWCEKLKDCVECVAHNTGPLAKNERCNECPHQIDIVDAITDNPLEDQKSEAHICRTNGEEGCIFIFKYQYYRDSTGGEKIFKILAEKGKTCPTPINVVGIAAGLMVSTVILGFLILLIWKIWTTIYDRREYAKFEQERALAKWHRDDNPLYKQATSTFKNPMYDEVAHN
ncbi:integrin beta-PS-like isoform X1 [Colletes gigas]|uniref:integrin beta-PS-like isoform X1 n=1 Tax=Colletes gigas TaxID=935657 RepID=UPI001C9A43A0|nr:integrin beta-PS-like isoform X1 [Colletes gigas]